MKTHEQLDDNSAAVRGGGEANISHFIPSCELKGSRLEQLERLDVLIGYLQRLRRSLAGDVLDGPGGYEGPGRYLRSPAWPWFTGGVLLGALFVLVLLTARGCGL